MPRKLLELILWPMFNGGYAGEWGQKWRAVHGALQLVLDSSPVLVNATLLLFTLEHRPAAHFCGTKLKQSKCPQHVHLLLSNPPLGTAIMV